MQGYFENSSWFYIPQLGLAATPLLGNLRENYLHWQASVELVCVLRGSVTVEVEGTAYPLQPGDVLTIDAFRPHRYFAGTADGLQMMMTIDDALLQRPPQTRYVLGTVGGHALSRNDPVLSGLRCAIGRLCELLMPLKQGQFADTALKELSARGWHEAHMLTHQICMLLAEYTVPAAAAGMRPPAEFLRCIEYIHEHYGEPCTAAEVARACGFSERSLRRQFRQHLEQSFGEYLTGVRLMAARSLLENTDCSMADAAASIGLSTSSFYRIFHRAAGMSPREYQEKVCRGDAFSLSPLELSRPLLQRNLFVPIVLGETDWDWIAGRKGWVFGEQSLPDEAEAV